MLEYLLWLADEPAFDRQAHGEQTIASLLRIFVSAPLPNAQQSPEPPELTRALDHMRRVWATKVRPVSLPELAAAGCVSKEHLARLFRRRFGTGVINALELVRLDRAAKLLMRSNLNITEIANSSGFHDPLHFSRRFRAAYGVSPRQYREQGASSSLLAEAKLHLLARRITEGRL